MMHIFIQAVWGEVVLDQCVCIWYGEESCLMREFQGAADLHRIVY